MLEWLGDVGGLFDGLALIINVFLGPVKSLALKTALFSSLVSKTITKDHLVDDPLSRSTNRSILSWLTCKSPKSRRKVLMERMLKQVERQLDLKRFIQR